MQEQTRTNKNKATSQIAKHQRREAIIHNIASKDPLKQHKSHKPSSATDALPFMSPKDHHHIADSQRKYCDILGWVAENRNNPGIKVSPSYNLDPKAVANNNQDFIPRLKDHLLARHANIPYSGDEHAFSDTERDSIMFVSNRMYKHEVFRINYTSYDLRREQDSINVNTHPYIMVLSYEDEEEDRQHPYWYAKVLGIFHVNVRISGSLDIMRMDFLWVHWFGRDPDHFGGFKTRRLHRIGLLDASSTESFGFLNPSDVLRAVHLIPTFAIGRTPALAEDLGADEDNADWAFFYVSM